jgi:NUMOD4 motif-containing protein
VDDHSAVTERWLPVVGWVSWYEVSDWGQVRSVDRLVYYKNGQIRSYKGKRLKPDIDPTGRRRVPLWRKNKGHTRLVHQLVLEAFIGPRPLNMNGCHNNGDHADDRLINLRWDSQSENIYDEVRHGTHRQSSKSHCPVEHLLQAPNLVAADARDGYRSCLACDRVRGRVRKARKAGRPYDVDVLRAQCYAEIMGSLVS